MSQATPDDLFAFLRRHGIDQTTVWHEAVFRVEDGPHLKASLPGGHSKNLFLKDAKGRAWLVTALDETQVDLKALPKTIGAARLSFGSADLLLELVGVRPGSVSPFGLINDEGRRVSLVIDAALLAREPMNFHPLTNTATTAISRAGLAAFLKALGTGAMIVDFSASPPVLVDGEV
jgi:Ala-tRNA(Pro) deacylase